MKIQWSVFLLLFIQIFLMSCGSEEFGTVPRSSSEEASPLQSYAYNSCTIFTTVKPKVDVLYIVDNSSSSYYIANDIKNALASTVNSLSSEFDFRVIGTPLLETITGNNDFQVMTNSSDLQGIPSDSRRVQVAGGFNFFANQPITGVEKGLNRLVSFVDHHKNNLIRKDAHLISVLISNGRDLEIEEDAGFLNGETKINLPAYNARLSSLRSLKATLNSLQLRLISVTARQNNCGKSREAPDYKNYEGWRGSEKSYIKMSNDLYLDSKAQDSNTNLDSYDLCNPSGINSIFAAINNSIKQVILPHGYRYWPITFAENNEVVSTSDVKVQKIDPKGTSVTLIRDVDWFYRGTEAIQTINTREKPTSGEPYTGRHFIEFSNLVTYPDCVLVTSVSRTEYFGFFVLPQKPKVETISVRINGRAIGQSSTDGWSDLTSVPTTRNIKVPHPSPGDENPTIIRTGFMIQLNGSANYYKSGDKIEVNFIPAGI
jgi:hypothetical protein